MSSQPAAPDFASPNTFPNASLGAEQMSIRTRPAGVSATGVLSIIAGVMGGMSSLSMIASLLFSNAFAQIGATQAQGMPSEQAKAMEEMNAATQAIASKYMLVNGGITVLTCFISLALLIGGIGLLKSRPRARKFLCGTFIAAIINELLSSVIYVMSQTEMAPVMGKYMGSMSGSGGNQMASGGAEAMGRMMIFFGLAVWGIWAITKIILYVVGSRYLNRSHVIEYLEGSVTPPSS